MEEFSDLSFMQDLEDVMMFHAIGKTDEASRIKAVKLHKAISTHVEELKDSMKKSLLLRVFKELQGGEKKDVEGAVLLEHLLRTGKFDDRLDALNYVIKAKVEGVIYETAPKFYNKK